MNIIEIAKYFSEMDAPDKWMEEFIDVEKEVKIKAFKLAEPMWVEKMATSGKLFVHPDILKQLQNQSWISTDIQNRMIWASVLASADGKDSKKRFKNIKTLLLKKYGREWWEDVYKRKNNAWAAKERIRKTIGTDSQTLSMMVNKTLMFSGIAAEENLKALSMIPST